jgi:hypothetical protein
VRSIWLGSAGQLEGLERQVEVADDRVVDELDAGVVDLDVGGRPTGHEFWKPGARPVRGGALILSVGRTRW